MLATYLFCLSAAVVASNPVFQRIPIQLTQQCPTQTCPAQISPAQITPQQFSSAVCPACPAQTCVNQIQPNPCQTCQNNGFRSVFSPVPVVHQPSNNCHCNKPVVVQNQIPNAPVNQEVLNQLVLSKLLSPQLQMLLNSAPKPCQQCEPKNPNTDVVPNIINNYIIIPSEYFKPNETNVKNNETAFKKRKSNGRRKQNQEIIQNNGDNIEVLNKKNDEVDNSEVNIPANDDSEFKKTNRRPRKRNRQRKGENTCTDAEINTPNNLTPSQDTPINLEPPSCLVASESPNGSGQGNENVNRHVLFENLSKTLGNAVSVNNKGNDKDASDKIVKTTSPSQTLVSRQNRPDRARIAEEAIIKDFCEKHPGIPEEIARSLLSTLERQVQGRGSSYFSPNFLVPFSYNQNVPQSDSEPNINDRVQTDRHQNNRRQSRPKKNRTGRRNKNTRDNLQNDIDSCNKCEKTVELNPTIVNIESETITTEKITTTTENKIGEAFPKKVSETQVETPKSLVDKLEQIKDKFVEMNEIETTTVNYNKRIKSFPELGQEDELPKIYDNGVDDYYPDFRGDNIDFYASEEDLDRYHYTTDRNSLTDGKKNYQRYVKSKKHNIIENKNCEMNDNPIIDKVNSEYVLPIPTEESDESLEGFPREKSDEIQFRTPPSLELPDFKTKQINKYYSAEELTDKFVADDTKAAELRKPETELSTVKVFSKDEKGRTNIETVYGHSKVVKYGQDVDVSASTPVITYYLPEEAITRDRIQLPEGDKSIVVAKSIKNVDEIWS